MRAFEHIAERIDQVYKDLKNKAAPMGGSGEVQNSCSRLSSLVDGYTQEPYLRGINYRAMPPIKRFRDIYGSTLRTRGERRSRYWLFFSLSTGEREALRTFSLRFKWPGCYQPTPSFVLDEVDAAFENVNIAKLVSYTRKHTSDTFRVVVISQGSIV